MCVDFLLHEWAGVPFLEADVDVFPRYPGLPGPSLSDTSGTLQEKGSGSKGSKVKITIGYVGCAINRVFVDLFVIQSHRKLHNFSSEF